MDTNFEQIVPWNGAQDTGRDVRMKWMRNFAKIASAFIEQGTKIEEWAGKIEEILKEQDNFLRKDKEDSTEFLISLLGGVLIKGLARFGEFVTGVSGGMIDEKGRAELESLLLRSELIVPAIRYNYMTYFMGYNLITPGGGLKVKEFSDNGDGSWTVTPDLEEGMPCGQYTDDILLGYWYDKNEQTGDFAGFKKMQFRVTSVDYDAKKFVMVAKPDTDAKPYKELKLGQTGNFTNEERQTYMILDVRDGNNNITLYDHANTWDPEPAQVMSWFGKKKGMTVNGISCDNYSGVLQNILMTGLIFQIDEITGQSVRVPIDKGDWEAGRYGYYNRVSHNGSLWLCVATGGTTEEPGTGNDWLKQVSEGKPGDKGDKGDKGDPGLSVVGGGHWESSKTPYAANTLVSFCNCVFLSKKETSNPPLAIARFKDGSYVRMKDSGYILAGKYADFEVNADWDMLLDGRELQGRSITFLGKFDAAPSNPQEGNAYYNKTDRCTYIWQNGQWMLMVSDGKDGTDYEYIYTRNNSIGTAPEKPDSRQQDDYVPSGWTDDFLGVSETFQVEWGCKRTKKNGTWSEWSAPAVVHRWSRDGENAVMADLDNEMVGCALTSDGMTPSAQSWTTNAGLWFGYEKLELTDIATTQDKGLTVSADKDTGTVTVSVAKGISLAETNNVVITLRASRDGQNFERQLTFTVSGVRAGSPGADAVIYSLLPSVSSVAKYKDGTYSVESVSCKRQKTVGGTLSDTTDGTLRYSIDGGAENGIGDNTQIAVNRFNESLKFLFYVGDRLVDVETIPLLTDGADGEKGDKGDPGLSVVGGGHWESSKTPYAANTLVSFCNCVFLSKKETSNPPLAIARFKDGSYVRMKDSGYILAGKYADFEVNADWDMLLDGRELQGRSITFLGKFDAAPSNPQEGNAYYNKKDKCTYIWQNGQWMLMVSDGKDGTDYEYIYTRNNSIGTAPDRPDSRQQDDYVPSGWTDDFLGVSETFQVEWGCKRSKKNGTWSEWSTPAVVHRWSKDGEDGKDGTDGIGIEAAGHWEYAQTPYTKNQLVNFGRGTFLALTTTSNPPLAIARFKDGSYIRKKDGGYILAGRSADRKVNADWQMMSWADESPVLYWLDCPVIAFNFTSTGSPSPGSVEVSCRQSRNGAVSDCTTLWLAARRYNGSWSTAVSAVQSGKIAVSASAGYTQYVVRAYTSQADANAWNAGYVAERGIGVAQDGMQGRDGTDYEYIFTRTTTDSRPATPATAQQDDYVPSDWTDDPQGVNNTYPYEWSSMRTKNDGTWGPFCTPYKFGVKGDKGDKGEQGMMGAFPYDRGVFKNGQSYVWNSVRRDKIIYMFNNVYYNFLVKNYGATVTAAPTSVNGDSNWEAMQKFESIVTDTFFADGANIAGLMFKLLGYNSDVIPYGEVRSQNTNSSGVPTFYLNTKTGYLHCEDVDVSGTINGVLKTLRTEGNEIVLNSGQAWFNGVDLYNQGTVNGRPLRFYANSIWCRGNFAARSRLTIRIVQTTVYFYPNGTGMSYVAMLMKAAGTYNGHTYYEIPCYGDTGSAGTPTEVAGMPVDTIVIRNSSIQYYYTLGLYDTQKVTVYNANDNYSVHLFINGNDKTLDGGKGCTVQQIPVSWLTPTVSSSTPGAGQLIAGEKDENWA